MKRLRLVFAAALALAMTLPLAAQNLQFGTRPMTKDERAAIEKMVGHSLPKNATITVVDGRQPVCYTMRVYEFRRHDGEAPVLNGTTDCVPATSLKRRTHAAAGARYLPQ